MPLYTSAPQPPQAQAGKHFQRELIRHRIHDDDFKRQSMPLKPDDFTLPLYQFVFEVLLQYERKYNKRVEWTSFKSELIDKIDNPAGMTHYLPDDEYEVLAEDLSILKRSDGLDPDYYLDKLDQYIRDIRYEMLKQEHGGDSNFESTRAMIKEVDNSGIGCGIEFFNPDADKSVRQTDEEVRRMPTGLNIDYMINGGLGRGELGMMLACSGIGKTTLLCNICSAVGNMGIRSLFITLEDGAIPIRDKLRCVTWHIHPAHMEKKESDIPDDVLRRIEYCSDHTPGDMRTILDLSMENSVSLDRIEQAIAAWKKYIADKYPDDPNADLVFVDWLGKLEKDPQYKDAKDEQAVTQITDRLATMARVHDVGIWLSHQANRGGVGKERLSENDISRAYGSLYSVAVGIGISAVNDNEFTGAGLGESKNANEIDRDVTLTLFKNRKGAKASVTFYQGPTLRVWNEEAEYRSVDKRVDNGEWSILVPGGTY